MKKRLTALLLCFVMVLCLLPAAAADGEEEPVLTAEPTETADEAVDAVGTEPEEGAEASDIIIDEKNFPDANFRKWIVYNVPGVTVDANGVCSITKEAAKKVETIDVTGEKISTLVGIGKFPNLVTLTCDKNTLKSLDVSGNKKLVALSCASNQIEKLTLGSTKQLMQLDCSGNKLTKIKLEKNAALTVFEARNNALTSLDLSACTALAVLDCSNNSLKKLDVSKNTKLGTLICDQNEIASLDVTKNPELQHLEVRSNALTALDVTKNTKLQNLDVAGNKLKAVDISNCPEIDTLYVDSNELTAIDVTKNPKIVELRCANNKLKALDVSQNTAMRLLDACGNVLTAIDVTKNTKLESLALYENGISSLNVSENKALSTLNVGANKLKALNLSQNTKLETLKCAYNELQALDLAANTALKELDCANNALTALDLGMLTNLKTVSDGPQERLAPTGIIYSGGDYRFDMSTIASDFSKIETDVYPFNKLTGFVTLPGYVNSFEYLYDTGKDKMTVKLYLPYTGTAKVEFDQSAVQFKGTTPYVVYNKKAQTPAFRVLDESGSVIDPSLYTYTYTDNTNPGTAYVNIKFLNTTNTATGWFKIYLPATTGTTVENVQEGIKITWKAVDGAKGYVIYRRAWSSTTNGWTNFARWNYVEGKTTWTDGTDSAHQVYAGTRYQYGVKAYFGDPLDNYNLGIVGPLKTTVRITTRVLTEVTPYKGKLVVKWAGSKVFTGYEVQYARDAAFTQSVKTVKIDKADTYSTTLKNLTSGKTYYVRVRSYHIFEGFTYYGQWSNVLSAKVK